MRNQSRSVEVSASPGFGWFFMLLGLLFIGLKLAEVIDWSWWLVLLPIYGGIALILAVLAIVGIISLIAYALTR